MPESKSDSRGGSSAQTGSGKPSAEVADPGGPANVDERGDLESSASPDAAGSQNKLNSAQTIRIKCPTCGALLEAGVNICQNDGTVFESLEKAVGAGPQLAREYEYVSRIGEGGMGVIYKARHIALNQMVAIKMMHAHKLDSQGLRRFQQEARSLSALDHPNIVRVRDFGVTESGQPHLVLDYVSGESLAQRIATEGALPLVDAIGVFVEVADALEHAHERGILHRDLKPSNIMLQSYKGRYTVKIVDFGIAKLMDDGTQKGLTQTGEVFGSPHYMSPEQAAGENLDARSDIYSLGCVMFEALTGAPPFDSQSSIEVLMQQMNKVAPTLREASLGKEFPPEVEALIAKALRKRKEDRFKSMCEFKEALIDTKLGRFHESLSAAPLATPVVAQNRFSPKTISIVGVVAIAILAAGFAISYFHKSEEPPAADPRVTALDRLLTCNDVARDKILKGANSKFVGGLGWCTDEPLANFDKCIAVEDVDLNRTSVNGEGLEHLKHLPVKKLNLYRSEASDVAVLKASELKTLEQLNLGELTTVSMESLPLLTRLPHLQKLGLKGTHIDDTGAEYISQVRALTYLNVKENPNITSHGMSDLGRLKHLKELAINDGQLTSFLSVAPMFQSLEQLDLSGAPIATVAPSYFSRLKLLPNLQTLSIRSTPLSHDQILVLAKLPHLKTVELVNYEESKTNDPYVELQRLRPSLHIERVNDPKEDGETI